MFSPTTITEVHAGGGMGNAEIAKPFEATAPRLMQWYRHFCDIKQARFRKPGEVRRRAYQRGRSRAISGALQPLLLVTIGVAGSARAAGLKDPANFRRALLRMMLAQTSW